MADPSVRMVAQRGMSITLLDYAWQLLYRVVFTILAVWWSVRAPQHFGAQVAVRVGDRFLLLRSSYRRHWQFPGGGLDANETPEEAAARELVEEVGLAIDVDELEQAQDTVIPFYGRRDRTVVFNLPLHREPPIRIDNREIVEARFLTAEEALKLPLNPHTENFLIDDEFKVRSNLTAAVGLAGLPGGEAGPEEAQSATIVTAAMLVIGNEILSGRTQDANVRMVASGLDLIGVRLREVRVIPDDADIIIDTVNELRAQYDYLMTTGGIGPTHDDITADCVARAFGVPLLQNPDAVSRLAAHYASRNVELNEARLRMALIPQGATLIDNPVSAAPGFQIENVFVMAGVPRIAEAMFQSVKQKLRGGDPLLSRTVVGAVGEGSIAQPLSNLQERFPDVEIGSYPFWSDAGLGVNLVLRSIDAARLQQAVEESMSLMREAGAIPTLVEPA